MTARVLGPDPLDEQVERVLELLKKGEPPGLIETARVDVKEEPGRRTHRGEVLPGSRRNDRAARYLAGEMACMANTPGGGAVILGVADDGARIGTELEPEWLRRRIWELTERKLTVAVRAAELDGARLLVLSAHQALEPIRCEGRIRWRVDARCVDVDPTTWYTSRMSSQRFDWSAQPSGRTLSDLSPTAVETARMYLRENGQRNATDLAEAADEDLVRRLDLADGEGRLTNAGSLLLVGTPSIGIDYIRRDALGTDSVNRVRGGGPLLRQIADVERASENANRSHRVLLGFRRAQVRSIPSRVVREAIVNGVVHRDWHSPSPTLVEHAGDQMTVASPGGFIRGVSPSNIITHPAEPRYPSLAEAAAALGIAEREGVGVDMMIRYMLAAGLPPPDFGEIAGPYVRVGLLGGPPDPVMLRYIDQAEPGVSGADVDLLLILDHSIRRGWIDPGSAAPLLHRSEAESEAALRRVSRVSSSGRPIIVPVAGAPVDHPPAYRLSNHGRKAFTHRTAPARTPEGREALLLDWARRRGRISSTEAADLAGVTVPYAGRLLADLARRGLLAGSRPNGRGRGFHYLPVG